MSRDQLRETLKDQDLPLLVLVVGYGSMGKRHARNARELGHNVVVWDLNSERRREALGDGFSLADFDPCWMQLVNVTIVATPTSTHDEVVRRLEDVYCGPVFVEKPLDNEGVSSVNET